MTAPPVDPELDPYNQSDPFAIDAERFREPFAKNLAKFDGYVTGGGIDPARVSVDFVGRPLEIPVGPGWLGRVWSGMGEPLDGGPPMLGAERRAALWAARLRESRPSPALGIRRYE